MKLSIETTIKGEIESVFGRRIVTSRDCIQLAQAIFLKTHHQLNPNTLRRFFGLVKAPYAPSQTTLSILSKYCGYACVSDVGQPRYEEATVHHDQYDVLSFMVGLFRDVPVNDMEDKTFISLVYNTVAFLNRNPSFASKFQVQVAKTKNGQEFYFEKFVNIDKLNAYYGNGLRYYYNEKQTTAAKLFAHSLLTYRYWLTDDAELLAKHYMIVADTEPDDSVPPFIYGRYWAAALYYAHANKMPAEPILQQAYGYYNSVEREKAGASFPRFELYLAEALVLTGYPHEALLFIEQAKKHETEEGHYTHWKFFQNVLLLETIAACMTDDFVRAEEIFEQINPAQFYFLRKSFSNILYLHIIKQLKRQSAKHTEQLDALVNETGFTRLRQLFNHRLPATKEV